jgi:hypothetical protein
MVKKKIKKRKKINKEIEYDHSKIDNFLKKYGILILIGFGVLGFILDPTLWYNIGERVWIALPVIGILAFYSLLSGDKKQPFNFVGVLFIVIILLVAIFGSF